jgi:hypothetical protein
MSSKLFTRYSFDECSNETKLFEKLDSLLEEGKIEYNSEDQYLFKIKDIDLTDDEIEDLCVMFDKMEVYPYIDNIDDDISDDDDNDDNSDDYTGRRYRGDDYDDDY